MAVQTPSTEQEPRGPVGTIDAPRAGRWVDVFDPEDQAQWAAGGRRMARRNLWWSIGAEFLGFTVWQLWSIATPVLVAAGYAIALDQQLWLTAVPVLVGATLRFPYSFAVGRFGGRNWTIISALLLVVPCLGLAYVAYNPGTPFWAMLLIAATAGVGGGNFASSMSNIHFFFPQREKGAALGLNAAGGNIGVAVIQAVTPFVVVAGIAATTARPAIFIIPLAVLAALGAWRFMDNLAEARSDGAAWRAALSDRHTWLISFLYIGTFGSFIGYAAAFPTLLKSQFPDVTLTIAFLGALIGSLARPWGGRLSDRVGGARVSIVAFAVLALGAVGAVVALRMASVTLFFLAFMVLFVASGVGNGSVYRMIPAVFRRGVADGDVGAGLYARRITAACIGVAAGIGAYGGFLINRGFAESSKAFGSLQPALWAFVGFYVLCIAVTWAVYARRGALGTSERI
ncbi:MFS transporter [uncultured Pseudokineococcus sp.]|uniref:MFS transporter n=1 Tax=uncultured Pseudokineococcus sp. TaxID=1642928 RepID=UPI00262603B6|nr:nitrate/nitrite transporter [uncultured Pseudokineococcus sp.]